MKKKKRVSRAKPKFERMRADQLAEATAPYGQEMAVKKFGPMGVGARKRWERARRKPGRPRRGKGAKVISVSVERELLSRSDELARNLRISRASLIERGLKAVLIVEGKR
jgi:hypothetical protein